MVMITMPRELLEDVDSTRKRLNQNRSEFIRNAVIEFLKKELENGKEFKELMARGYIEMSKQNGDE